MKFTFQTYTTNLFITAFDVLGMSSGYPAPVAQTQTYIKGRPGYNTRPADLTVPTLNFFGFTSWLCV